MFTHVDKNGKSHKLCDITNSHLSNIITRIERKAKIGVEVFYGGGGPDIDDYWGDYEIITGDEVLEMMDYKEYIAERKRRLDKLETF